MAIFEIAKNGIWSKKIFFVKLIYLNSQFFLAWTFLIFLAHYVGSGPSGMWTLLFTLSKVAELGDTLLLLIHGKELSFLHVFHHSTVLLWGWQQYVEASAPNFVYTALNLFVHTLMYTYFALAVYNGAANMRTAAAIITTVQCSQFVIALVVSTWAGVVSLSSGGSLSAICATDVPCSCRFNLFSFVSSLFFYFAYLILFINFANKAYALSLRFSMLFNSKVELLYFRTFTKC